MHTQSEHSAAESSPLALGCDALTYALAGAGHQGSGAMDNASRRVPGTHVQKLP